MSEDRTIDLRTSKSTTGRITEVFREWPGVLRSSHPFSSVCAWGARAEYITALHAANPFVCHAESPIGRIVELDASIIGIGVPVSVGLSVAHYLEDTCNNFPFAVHSPPFEVTYRDAQGETVTRSVVRYDPVRSRTRIDHLEGKWILKMFTRHFTNRGLLRWFSVGDAPSWIARAKPLYVELLRLAEKGITMYLTREEWIAMSGGETIDAW